MVKQTITENIEREMARYIGGESICKIVSSKSEYYPFEKLIEEQDICQPYEENIFREMVVSNKPFSGANYYVADFHSPILDLGVCSGHKGCWGGSHYLVHVPRGKNSLIQKLLGQDFSGRGDLLDPKLKNSFEDLFRYGIVNQKNMRYGGSYNLHADTTANLMKGFSSPERVGSILGNRYGEIEPIISVDIKVNEIAFFSNELKDHKIGRRWYSHDYPTKSGSIVDSGFVTIKQEDYLQMGSPNNLYVRVVDTDQEWNSRKRITAKVKRELKIFAEQSLKDELKNLHDEIEDLVEKEFAKFLREKK